MTSMLGTIEHAEQTVKRWEEQQRWRIAEERGEDLTLLAQQWRQEQLDGIAAGRLSNSDIVEMCDEDTVKIIKRNISRLSRQINPIIDDIRVIKSSDLDVCAQTMALRALRWRTGFDDAVMRRDGLRSVLAATLVKQGKKEVYFDSITEKDVENAKSVGIEGLYDFTIPRRISGRFRACCPFHQESTGSFFIFQDNKFKCFGCQEHGDAIDFCMKTMGLDFIEAVKYLIKK